MFFKPLTIKLISLSFFGTEPPKSPDTSMNVWCPRRISKISPNKHIGLAVRLKMFFFAKCRNTNNSAKEVMTGLHLRIRQ